MDIHWTVESLAKKHDRSAFACGNESLDTFLRVYATQYQKKGISQTYVAIRGGESQVCGYYTISTGSMDVNVVPEEERKKLPSHAVPTLHLGRLAVDQSVQKQSLGRTLLYHFLGQAIDVAAKVGVHAVDVVALNESARNFYLKYGFKSLQDDSRHLYLPIKTLRKMFGVGGTP